MGIIKLNQVSKFYYSKNNISSGFSKVSLDLDAGEFVVITGESGSGKSTLLNVISGLDSYEEGEMYINGEETSHYTYQDYENYRRKYIGNIFQNFNLVNSYTVYQNIELVLLLNGYKKSEVKQRVLDVIKKVGLTRYKNTKASKLSGGQKQRVAIARALVKDTPIIVADEPTGNLDLKSAESIMKLLYEISKDKLVVIVTHNYEQVEEYATRKITMHDGKIIMDKKLKKDSNVDIKPSEYNDIRFVNKILLGIRNAFNIKTKFLLLCVVYFVLTLFVFSSYSALQKIAYDSSLDGYHPYFMVTSYDRIIINKKDGSTIKDDDVKNLKSLSNIKDVIQDDLIVDSNYAVHKDGYYYYGSIKNADELSSVTYGRLPSKDDEVVVTLGKYEVVDESILESVSNFSDDYGYMSKNVKIVGINESDENVRAYIYVRDGLLKEISKANTMRYSIISFDLNGSTYGVNDTRLYFKVLPSKNVARLTALVPENMDYICYKWNCINNYGSIKLSSVYSTSHIEFRIADKYNEKNYGKKTGLSDDTYYANSYAIFVNEDDYMSLFPSDTYQSSVFVSDTKLIDKTINEIKDLGYNTFAMKDMMKQSNEAINSVMRILRTMLFAVAVVALFFISYFIIKIILKSRNSYFGTIRTLGATKNISRDLLNIELFVDINFIYIVFICLIKLVQMNVIKSAYIKDMVTYFTLADYVIIYVLLVVMSLLISLRYARGLFKNTIMNAYREEV